MSFNLDETITEFHYPVTGQCNQQPVSFIGRFKAYETDEEIEAVASRISAESEGDPNGIGPGMRRLAAEFFLGWANPEGQEDQWVTHDDGRAMECTADLVAVMLAKPGLSVAICKSFQEARFGTEAAKLGNSGSSRGNGFRAQVQRATPG
jgi:hypothetical protein